MLPITGSSTGGGGYIIRLGGRRMQIFRAPLHLVDEMRMWASKLEEEGGIL